MSTALTAWQDEVIHTRLPQEHKKWNNAINKLAPHKYLQCQQQDVSQCR